MSARCFALIPAAGVGARMAVAMPKQYLPVAGTPMIVRTLDVLAAVREIDRIVVVVSPEDRRFASLRLKPEVADRVEVHNRGGGSRHETVANGLAAMADYADRDDWVLVHDAARCGIWPALVIALIEVLKDDPVGGLLALPVADTLKRAEVTRADAAGGRVEATLDRDGVWLAQTPQMFRYGMLADALAAADARGFRVTDEASAIEAAGHSPRLVLGSSRNFKVTTSDDLAMMRAMLAVHPS